MLGNKAEKEKEGDCGKEMEVVPQEKKIAVLLPRGFGSGAVVRGVAGT